MNCGRGGADQPGGGPVGPGLAGRVRAGEQLGQPDRPLPPTQPDRRAGQQRSRLGAVSHRAGSRRRGVVVGVSGVQPGWSAGRQGEQRLADGGGVAAGWAAGAVTDRDSPAVLVDPDRPDDRGVVQHRAGQVGLDRSVAVQHCQLIGGAQGGAERQQQCDADPARHDLAVAAAAAGAAGRDRSRDVRAGIVVVERVGAVAQWLLVAPEPQADRGVTPAGPVAAVVIAAPRPGPIADAGQHRLGVRAAQPEHGDVDQPVIAPAVADRPVLARGPAAGLGRSSVGADDPAADELTEPPGREHHALLERCEQLGLQPLPHDQLHLRGGGQELAGDRDGLLLRQQTALDRLQPTRQAAEQQRLVQQGAGGVLRALLQQGHRRRGGLPHTGSGEHRVQLQHRPQPGAMRGAPVQREHLDPPLQHGQDGHVQDRSKDPLTDCHRAIQAQGSDKTRGPERLCNSHFPGLAVARSERSRSEEPPSQTVRSRPRTHSRSPS